MVSLPPWKPSEKPNIWIVIAGSRTLSDAKARTPCIKRTLAFCRDIPSGTNHRKTQSGSPFRYDCCRSLQSLAWSITCGQNHCTICFPSFSIWAGARKWSFRYDQHILNERLRNVDSLFSCFLRSDSPTESKKSTRTRMHTYCQDNMNYRCWSTRETRFIIQGSCGRSAAIVGKE